MYLCNKSVYNELKFDSIVVEIDGVVIELSVCMCLVIMCWMILDS